MLNQKMHNVYILLTISVGCMNIFSSRSIVRIQGPESRLYELKILCNIVLQQIELLSNAPKTDHL